MEDGLKIFDKFLNDRLLHHPIIILGILTDHDRRPAICTKGSYQTSLKRMPNLVWDEEDGRLARECRELSKRGSRQEDYLDSKHEGDPLVVRSVRSIVSTFYSVLVHYTPEVGLGADEGVDDV